MSKYPLLLLVIFLFTSCKEEKATSEILPEVKNAQLMKKSFIGTYTRDEGWVHGKADGIYSFILDDNGRVTAVEKEVSIINPSYVSKSNNGKFLLAVSELGRPDEDHGFIKSFRIDDDRLVEVSMQSTLGAGPCYVSTSSDDKLVFVANYGGGSVCSYTLDNEGILSLADSKKFSGKGSHARQEAPHAHAIYPHPINNQVFIPDLGNDKIWIMGYDGAGMLTPGSQPYLEVSSESGPRHIAISDDGMNLYVMNELSNKITHFMKNNEIYLEGNSYPTLPDTYSENNTSADIHIHPSGKFLYSSNRGHNSIAKYKIASDGTLTEYESFQCGGAVPRNFNISPDGNFLLVANQDSDNLVTFEVAEISGQLSKISVTDSIYTPVCIEW